MVPAFAYVLYYLVRVADLAGQQGSRELHRIMGLQIGSVICDQCVCGAVGLVEPVFGKLGHKVKYLLCLFGIDLLVPCAFQKPLLLLGHLIGLLLTHGAPQDIGFTEGVPGHSLAYLHHLFLVDHNAVSILEDRFKLRDLILDLNPPMLTVDKLRDHVHRPGPVQGDKGYDVLKCRWFKPFQKVLHSRALKLEDPGCIP